MHVGWNILFLREDLYPQRERHADQSLTPSLPSSSSAFILAPSAIHSLIGQAATALKTYSICSKPFNGFSHTQDKIPSMALRPCIVNHCPPLTSVSSPLFLPFLTVHTDLSVVPEQIMCALAMELLTCCSICLPPQLFHSLAPLCHLDLCSNVLVLQKSSLVILS